MCERDGRPEAPLHVKIRAPFGLLPSGGCSIVVVDIDVLLFVIQCMYVCLFSVSLLITIAFLRETNRIVNDLKYMKNSKNAH